MKLIYEAHPTQPYPHVFRFQGELDVSYYDCIHPILDWCRESFGHPVPGNKRGVFGNDRWFNEVFALYFRDEVDAFAVRLRWC